MVNLELITDMIREMNIGQIRIFIEESIRANGWKTTLNFLTESIENICGDRWFTSNWIILSILELEELLGFDGKLIQLLNSIDNISSFSELQEEAHSRLINKISKQVSSGGSTLLFDIELMTSTQSVLLVQNIIEARRKEFLTVVSHLLNIQREDQEIYYIDLRPLWRTSFGFDLLRAHLAEVKSVSLPHTLWKNLESSLMEIHQSLSITKADSKYTIKQVSMSDDFSDVWDVYLSLLVRSTVKAFEELFSHYPEILENHLSVSTPRTDSVDISRYHSDSQMQDLILKVINSDISQELSFLVNIIKDESIFPYVEYEDLVELHELVLTCYQFMMNRNLTSAVVYLIKIAHYENFDGVLSLINTSEEALERALYIAVVDEMHEVTPSLASMLDVPQSGMIARALVAIEGLNAAQPLIRNLSYHDRFDEYVNPVNHQLLVEMGEKVVPVLRNHLLCISNGMDGINSFVMSVLLDIGESGLDVLAETLLNNTIYHSTGAVALPILFEKNHPAAHDILLHIIQNLRFGDTNWSVEEIKKWFDSLNIKIESEKIITALDSEFVQGALTFLTFSPDLSSRLKLHSLLDNEDLALPATEALKRIADISSITPLLNLTLSLFDSDWIFYEYSWPVKLAGQIVYNLGLDAIEAVKDWLSSDEWRKRSVALLLLMYAAVQKDGPKLMKTANLDGLASHFISSLRYNSGVDCEYPDQYKMYAIVLGRVIPSEIFTNELNTDVVEKAVSTTPMIIQLINYIKHDVSLMARESIQDALSSRVEDILTILSQKHGELIVSSIMDVPFLKNDQHLYDAYKDKLREDK